jgi:hypothetical protein
MDNRYRIIVCHFEILAKHWLLLGEYLPNNSLSIDNHGEAMNSK